MAEEQTGNVQPKQEAQPASDEQQQSATAQQTTGGDCAEYKALVTALKSKVTRLENEKAGLQARIEELSGKAKQADELQQKLSELETLRAERDNLSRQLKRKEIIMSKFPNLAPFEADGLLPDAPEEELESRLQAFAEKLQAIAGANAVAANAGAVTPPNTPAGGGDSAAAARGLSMQDLIEKAMQAQKDGKMEEYNRYMDLILEMEA